MAVKIIEIGMDYWGRRLFRTDKETILVDIDGELYTVTPDWGEPCDPTGIRTPVKKESK